MSVSKWAYSPNKCDGEFCIGDCDLCYKANIPDDDEEDEIEQDGFITPSHLLESVSADKAKPVTECMYPECEDCDHYHGHYCTVPIVLTKQMYKAGSDLYWQLVSRLILLEGNVEDLMDAVFFQREEKP